MIKNNYLKKITLPEKAYWLRINYRHTWPEIGKIINRCAHVTKIYAHTYAEQNNYPIPLVRAKNRRQDIYIDRTNGLTWQKIAKKHKLDILKCKAVARNYARRNNYKWPPYVRTR